jgi:3-isopropylmalate/(R)-2-methylmalate dehydratase large subunit
MRRTSVRVAGRVLWLTDDRELLTRQLAGEVVDVSHETRSLLDNVSTDEIAPAWACYYYDETLGRYCLVGLRGGVVAKDAVRRGGYSILVSGHCKGCGSSRETAPASERAAGIEVIVARSLEKIYRQNCENIGLVTTTDFGVVGRLAGGEAVPIAEFTRGLDQISTDVVELGGLFAYNRGRLAGQVSPPVLSTPPRRLTLCEKIIAQHAVVDASADLVGVGSVAPGDSLFVRTDLRFSHDYVTAMARALMIRGFGPEVPVAEPESVLAFRDHLTFLVEVMPDAHVRLGLREQAATLAKVQQEFAVQAGVKLFGEVIQDGRVTGSDSICHQKVFERFALPGQVIAGTDSHTCMAGALGCLAFGVGATDMANAWVTRDVRLAVPATIRLTLEGRLPQTATAKDVMLHVLRWPLFREGEAIGKVLEFSGEGVEAMSLDERATLTNMAVEGGAFTGIIAADEVVARYLVTDRGLDEREARDRLVRGDEGAEYASDLTLDLATVEPMVALPGDPKSAVTLRDLARVCGGDVRIDIAYGGSCTGGKKSDMDLYFSVLSRAIRAGRRAAPGVRFFIQFGSQEVRAYADRQGYLETFERAGARLLGPSCGACINAGPGVSVSEGEVTVSAINRNYVGRSGPGKVFLANPLVVAASAILGKIASPEALWERDP